VTVDPLSSPPVPAQPPGTGRRAIGYLSAMSDSPHLLLSGCGPGEIMGWVHPLLDAMSRAGKRWRVSLVLWPRLFPSGSEGLVAGQTDRIHRVIEPRQALRLLRDPRPIGDENSAAVVVHLGGSVVLSWALSRRLDCPLVAYAERPLPFAGRFRRIYCGDAGTRDRMAERVGDPQRVRLVGNLFVDSVAELKRRRLARRSSDDAAPLSIGLFPGSRMLQLRHGLPLIAQLAGIISRQFPACRFLLARSPFVTPEDLNRALQEAVAAGQCPPGIRIQAGDDDLTLTTVDGCSIPIVERAEAFLHADVIVSSPGTNTAEAAALGIPGVTVVPYFAEHLLGPGRGRRLERLPLLGILGKRLLVRLLGIDMRYYAHANVRAGRELVPEVHGRLDAERIAEAVLVLLGNPAMRERKGAALLELMGPGGAALRMIDEIEAFLQDRPPGSKA